MFIIAKQSDIVLSEMDLTDKFLTEFQNYLVNPVVAGGAPRDWFFNKASTDIDIFVSFDTNIEAFMSLIDTYSEIVFQSFKTKETLPEHYRSNYIYSVLSFTYYQKQFQIICLEKDNIKPVCDNFPASICCITYQDAVLYPYDCFIRSLKNATIETLVNINTNYRIKLGLKFPNYTFIPVRSIVL